MNSWIIYNGNLPSSKFIDFAEMLKAAALRKKHHVKIYKNNDLLSVLDFDNLNLLSKDNIKLPDYIIFTDKDVYLANQFELLNVPLFNSARSIAISDDKIATYQALAAKQLPIPKTIIAPKIFLKPKENSLNINAIIDELGLPLIIKESFGSFGEQVYLIHSKDELVQKVDTLHSKPYMFQEFINTSYGKDLRLQVVGDEVVAAMMRTSKNDFRANITSGGQMDPYQPTKKEIELAVAGTKAIGADFAGVDILFGKNGPLICEINSNAHIRNMYECTNINVADFIIEHIIKTINNVR